MKITSVNIYLIMTILTLSVSSFFASYILLDEILDSSISLGVNQKTSNLLNNYQHNLKKLNALDPDNETNYKNEFYAIQDAMIVYQNPKHLIAVIKKSYLAYFVIIFIGILCISLLAALILSRQVSKAYRQLHSRDLNQSRRLQQLEHFDNWQQIAANLAHEIKNPLTPIELMITNLNDAYQNYPSEEFTTRLKSTQKIVLEEVSRLKNMVNHFSRFSVLPVPQLKALNFIEFITQSSKDFMSTWPNLNIKLNLPLHLNTLPTSIDENLIKQCLLNLVQNAIEANPKLEQVNINICFDQTSPQMFEFIFSNRGGQLSETQRQKIFQIGFSSKSNQDNRGLGLPIVKKILLDHQGDIECLADDFGVSFKITLPLASSL